MLKEFAQYLVSLKPNQVYSIEGATYSDHDLARVPKYIPRPRPCEVTGLDGVVKLIRTEAKKMPAPIMVRVKSPKEVDAFSALDEDMERFPLCIAKSDVPGFQDGFRPYEAAIIELRSRYIPNADIDYLLDLLSRINKENGVTTNDNGVSQTVEARSGISLKKMENIRPRVTLAPFRTFHEVEQPESEFLFRLDDDGDVGLFEADGGAWKQAAKQNIYDYFALTLAPEIEAGTVVVMM